MKYDRLTVNGAKLDKKQFIGTNYGEGVSYEFNEEALDNTVKVFNRLAELEDKIEQGTLIELPCKLGATIFCVTENSIITRTAFSFEISSLSRYIKTTMGDILSCDAIGKYIFLTREEAEKRLKEAQNGQTKAN